MGSSRFSWEKRQKSAKDIFSGHTEVYEMDLKSSSKPLFSTDFSICHALVFLDKRGGTLALAHMNCETYPDNLLKGTAGHKSNGIGVPRISEIYRDPSAVRVRHIYHSDMNMTDIRFFRDDYVEETLREHGFSDIGHVELYPGRKNEPYFRDMMVHPVYGEVYIFPRTSENYLTLPLFR